MYKRNQLFLAACVGLFVFGMTLITLGSILPQLKTRFPSESLNEGLLTAVLPVGLLFGSLVFGPIVDRYGYKLLLIISILLSALALEGLVLAETTALLYACIFIIGFGGGIINGGTSALVADISSENKGANLSLLGVSFGIGALGMPMLLGVLSREFSYNTILTAISICILLPVFFFLFIRFPPPKQNQGFPLKQGVRLLKEKTLLITSFFLFFQSGLESLINNWTTSFLQFKLQVSDKNALFALSFSLVGLTVARLLLGGLLKRISSFKILLISLSLVAAGSVLLMSAVNYETAFAALIIAGAGVAAGFPVILGYVGQLYAGLSGTAFSISLVIALIGNTLINYGFGFVVSKNDMGFLPVAMLICVGCMIPILIIINKKISTRINN